MIMITPQIHVNVGYETKYLYYKTYRELKKDILNVMLKYGVKSAFVIRSKRGQWGEWCERWEVDYRQKPYIVKEGWS